MKSVENKKRYNKFFRIKVKRNKLTQQFSPLVCNIGLQACETGKLTLKQIEACRVTLSRGLRILKKLKIRKYYYKENSIFFNNINYFMSETAKPILVRMGKGKGKHKKWVFVVKKGQILFEIQMKYLNIYSFNLLKCSMKKLPIKVKFVVLKY